MSPGLSDSLNVEGVEIYHVPLLKIAIWGYFPCGFLPSSEWVCTDSLGDSTSVPKDGSCSTHPKGSVYGIQSKPNLSSSVFSSSLFIPLFRKISFELIIIMIKRTTRVQPFSSKCVRFNCVVHKYILNNLLIILTAISASTIRTKTNWSGVVFL